jgi:DNA-binding NarL/FixJ family response regulator
MTKAIKVLLADDHELLSDMLADRLRSGGLEVFATGDTTAAIGLGVEHQPDVALLDIDMPGRSTFEVARVLRTESPNTRVVFLSAYVRDSYIEQALAVQASGYLSKSEPVDAILTAVEAVAAGATRFSRDILQRIVIDGSTIRLNDAVATRSSALTDREREVLLHIARGLSQIQVAHLLGISIKTVQTHLANVMEKLEIHDRVELARFAIREGIVEP